ncbi:hypothetical protein [Aminobacter niigataensis]|uniref:Uncharacterized protein n=1 Tax=Aminobacter niigataensis TaxID=83265 RepID=A0ABR6KVF9_9HYPH|nr:hypothetical protein [Aminobacter niigataensis]MBB4648430.1 hypothetical protein [Aminobacter niigataensis]
MLAHLFLLLLPVFAALTASVASSHAHFSNQDESPQLSAGDAPYTEPADPFALPMWSDSCVTLAEGNCDLADDNGLLRAAHGLPIAAIDSAASPAGSPFNFLRARTSAPRAPPAQA